MDKTINWQEKPRYSLVDQLRGFAVVLMIIYHFSYNLNFFGHIKIQLFTDPFWWTFPRVIVFLFLFVVGLSLPIAHPEEKPFNHQKYFKRIGKIALGALVITITTYFMFPSRWVYFGTLHCITICTLMVWPLIYRPITALIIGVLILIPWVAGFTYPWITLSHKSMDYIPALPWVSIVCLGLYAHHLKIHLKTISLPALFSVPLEFLGRHSLIIYLVHQPILFSSVWGFTWLMKRFMVS